MKHQKALIFFAFSLILLPSLAFAADVDYGNLISDSEITDYNSMTAADIQSFLTKRNGTLENYLTFDKEGNPKTAVQSFYEIAQLWQINPKYLMVLTQKEQSLLEDTAPSQKQYDWATGYGVCDNCSMDDPTIQRFKGFYRQVNSAAAQTRYYMDNINEFNFKPGKTYNIDGKSVKIQNTATAGLFNYTPHLHGNENFVNLWNKYFSKKWPDGTLLSTEEGDQIYYIEKGAKRLIASKAIMASRFDAKKIIEVSQSDIDSYENGPAIKYLNFSILKSSTTGEMFMIIDDLKRRIVSDAVYKKLGFSADDIEMTEDSELALYKDGPDITEYTVYATGSIVQDSKAKKPYENLFYVLSGEKRPIVNKEIFDANFAGLKVKKVTASELDNYMTGAKVTLPDGWLIRTKKVAAVYVISNGKRLPFANATAFKQMGYNVKNVKIITDETMNSLEIGSTIVSN